MLNAMNGEFASRSSMMRGGSGVFGLWGMAAPWSAAVPRRSASGATASRVSVRMSALLHHGDRRAPGLDEEFSSGLADVLRRDGVERLVVILDRLEAPGRDDDLHDREGDVLRGFESHQEPVLQAALRVGQL